MARILVIDDSDLSRGSVYDTLVAVGHDVVTANDGQEGLEAYASHRPDCIVLDLLMPRMGGQNFLQQLRADGSDTPVIISTVNIQEATREHVEELGISAYLNKPMKRAECIELVASVLEGREVVQ